MANGLEDLHEKNKDNPKPSASQKYITLALHQGREDAEMLMEKSTGWSAKKSSAGAYDDDDD